MSTLEEIGRRLFKHSLGAYLGSTPSGKLFLLSIILLGILLAMSESSRATINNAVPPVPAILLGVLAILGGALPSAVKLFRQQRERRRIVGLEKDLQLLLFRILFLTVPGLLISAAIVVMISLANGDIRIELTRNLTTTQLMSVILAAVAAVSSGPLALNYLTGRDSEESKDGRETSIPPMDHVVTAEPPFSEHLDYRVSSVEVAGDRVSDGAVSRSLERAEIIALIKETVSSTSLSSAPIDDGAKGRSLVPSTSALAELRARFSEMQRRLLSEIQALSRRGAFNLWIGAVTTSVAAAILAYVALTTKLVADDLKRDLPVLLMRLSLVVFIEVFAFFFLRLYRSSLMEIKYFQNELTNVETRFIALETAVAGGNASATKAIIEELIKTERNFVLKKGESTAELERLRFENQSVRDVVKSITDALTKKVNIK